MRGASAAMSLALAGATGYGETGGFVTTETLKEQMEKLKPLHKAVEKPGPSDWLARFPEEGQDSANALLVDN